MTAKALGGLAAHIDGGQHTLAWCAEILRTDAEAFRWTSATRDLEVDGDTYHAAAGLSLSSIASTVGLDVDNGKFTIGDGGDELASLDVIDGVWDGARYRIFRVNWADPAAGKEYWPCGVIADAEPRIGAFDLEFRDFRQALQQDTTRVHQEACGYTVGDPATCRKDLSAFTDTGVVVSAVSGDRTLTLAGLGQADGWYDEGRLLFTVGANANGIWRQIASSVGDVITLTRPPPRAIEVGDEVTIIAGCLHRFTEDCVGKFDNAANNGGCNTKPSVADIVTGELAA